jgi:hypothetical protein
MRGRIWALRHFTQVPVSAGAARYPVTGNSPTRFCSLACAATVLALQWNCHIGNQAESQTMRRM